MPTNIFDNKTVLITGGTGSFGKTFTKFILKNYNPRKVIIFSRDEFKQYKMQQELTDPRLRFFIGDVRDLPRLQRAFQEVNIVVHAAALKHVPALEYNPFEAVKTNIIGSQNIIEAAIDQKVVKVILVSSDKAVQPINLYGATKLSAEKLFVSANSYAPRRTLFSIVRYGNVVGSRGSIVETLLEKSGNGDTVKITDPEMTRFWLTPNQSCELVIFALKNMEGGEIFVPKIPSMKISDLFDVLAPNAKREIIGLRPGEKLHELLITDHETKNTYVYELCFVILPDIQTMGNVYVKYFRDGKRLGKDFKYTSDTNKIWLTAKKLKEHLKIKLL